MARPKKRTPKVARKGNKKRQQPQAAAVAAAPTTVAPQAAPLVQAQPKPQPVSAPTTLLDATRLEAVRIDVRRTLLLTAVFVGVELVLWYLIDYTSFGTSLYSHLIK